MSSCLVSQAGSLLRFAIPLVASICAVTVAAQEQASPAAPAKIPRDTTFQIPAGTILPVTLDRGFSSEKARPGQRIRARVMQAVPLANGSAIPESAKVFGIIVSASRAGKKVPGTVTIRFTEVRRGHQSARITSNVRAIASFMEVLYAETPESTPGFGTPFPWATTDLIGGDVKYGVGGPVTDSGSETVGVGTASGVLVHVRAKRNSPCHGDPESPEHLQALWVFSSDACGVYGMSGVKIAHAGRTAPVGDIVLSSESGGVRLHGGTALLLRVL